MAPMFTSFYRTLAINHYAASSDWAAFSFGL